MKLEQIKEMAKQEEPKDVGQFITIIMREKSRCAPAIDSDPEIFGCDVEVPETLIDAVEEKCDSENIPCYRISKGILSVADTYTKLAVREQYR